MSFSRGECGRKRAQKHQNSTVFKNDLHDKSTKIKQLNAMSINEVCTKCKEQIEWKIKFRKYKALTKPSTCNVCLERKVKKGKYFLDISGWKVNFYLLQLITFYVGTVQQQKVFAQSAAQVIVTLFHQSQMRSKSCD